jgi:hypothetical protein
MSDVIPPRTNPLAEFAAAETLQSRMGIDLIVGQQIAAIIVFAANIENHLERAIWALRGTEPSGTRPDTDAKQVTQLIEMLAEYTETLAESEQKTMLKTWCRAAISGFVIRNNIAHGIIVRMQTTIAFMRNTQWGGVTRKRPFGDLWADHGTLEMVRDSFAVLLRIIHAFSVGGSEIAADPKAKRALSSARSVLGEFASQDYNPSFEKY